jgi:hypothetical protein
MAIGKLAAKLTKAVTKKETRGRKSKRGRGIGTKAEKAEAKKLGISVAKLRAGKKSAPKVKKAIRSPVTPVLAESEAGRARQVEQAAAGLTGKGSKTIQRMMAQRPDTAGQPTRLPLVRGSAAQKGNLGEGVNTALPSKMQVNPDPKSYSRAQLRSLIKNGTVKLVKRGRHPDGSPRYIVVSTGRYAPPAEATAEAMGLGGSQRSLPSEKSLQDMGGFEIRKRGGTVRRRAGGAIGIGAALRGYGKGYKK